MSQRAGQPDSPVVFFVDRSLGGVTVPNALRSAGYAAEPHDAHFPPERIDTEWLEEVGKRGWAVLTKDRRIKSRTPELIAMIRAKSHVFILRQKKLNGNQQARAFVAAAPKMAALVESTIPPVLATVGAAGTINEVEGIDELLKRLRRP